MQNIPIQPMREHRQLQQLIAGLDDGIILVNYDKTILWANERALVLHGVAELQDLGANIDEYRRRFCLTYRNKQPVHKDDFPIERAIKGEKPREVTIEVSPIDEPEDSWTHTMRCLVITDEEGKPDYMVLVVDDETERYEAEDRFESAFNANPAPALICRLSDLRFVRVNRGFLEMTGYSREDIVGRSVYEFDVLAGSVDRDGLIKRLTDGQTLPQNEAEISLPDGGSKLVIVAGQPIEVSDVRCMLFTFADLEPRRRAERALGDSEERFSKAFRLSPVATMICSLSRFEFIEVNEAFSKLTGYAKEQVVGCSPLDLRLWAHPDTQTCMSQALETKGSLEGTDVQIRTSDGSPVDCLLTAETITINNAKCVLCVIQDITERKRSEAELMTAIETVMSETSWFSRTVVEKLAGLRQTTRSASDSTDTIALTDREQEVLGLICDGLSDAEIAERLSLSAHTVRNHLSSLFRKIGVRRRGAAVAWAREKGLPDPQARNSVARRKNSR